MVSDEAEQSDEKRSVKKKEYKKVVLVTYDTQKENFKSLYDRNKFYRKLFGYKQKVKKNDKYYEYEKDGIVDEIPCLRIEDSVFLIPEENYPQLEKYLKKWENKVNYQSFDILLKERRWSTMIKKKEQEGEKHE